MNIQKIEQASTVITAKIAEALPDAFASKCTDFENAITADRRSYERGQRIIKDIKNSFADLLEIRLTKRFPRSLRGKFYVDVNCGAVENIDALKQFHFNAKVYLVADGDSTHISSRIRTPAGAVDLLERSWYRDVGSLQNKDGWNFDFDNAQVTDFIEGELMEIDELLTKAERDLHLTEEIWSQGRNIFKAMLLLVEHRLDDLVYYELNK